MPVRLLGTLTAGLGINSRIGMKRRGVTAPSETIMLAQIFDALTTAIWSIKGAKGERPESQLDVFLVGYQPQKADNSSFASGREFEEERKKILERIK